jgi:ubiquinone/menaquinone biosynthesis C-methylase UbiE
MQFEYDSYRDRVKFLEFGRFANCDLLDIGAGNGYLSKAAIVERGCNVTCIDNHPEKLEKAKKLLEHFHSADVSNEPKIRFVQQDARAMTFPDKSFFAVACYFVLHHVEPDGRAKVISEALRVMKNVAIFAELTPIGAEFFDTVRHPEENHRALMVPKEWILNQFALNGDEYSVDYMETPVSLYIRVIRN